MPKPQSQQLVVELDGDTWRVIGIGVQKAGEVYVHLASTTRSSTQKNGEIPVQIACFVDEKLLKPVDDVVEMITHKTPRGKILTGVVAYWLTEDAAKEIDPYAFRKTHDDRMGWFIRDQHLHKLDRIAFIPNKREI